jgi:hypothetical protein
VLTFVTLRWKVATVLLPLIRLQDWIAAWLVVTPAMATAAQVGLLSQAVRQAWKLVVRTGVVAAPMPAADCHQNV